MTTPTTEAFEALAKSEGYDVAYTYDTERSRHVYLNPMTADLWRYYSAATERAAKQVWAVAEMYDSVTNTEGKFVASELRHLAAAIRVGAGKGAAS